MKEKKWGLVLAGGGGKGAYQIGVLKALKEFGLMDQIVAVSGSSVGALNAILFTQKDTEKMEAVWKKITPEQIVDISEAGGDLLEVLQQKMGILGDFLESVSLKEYLSKAKEEGICERDGLLKILESEVDLQKVTHSPEKIYATISSMKNGVPVAKYCLLNGKTEEEIKKLLLASSALPVIYDAVEIDGVQYRDGGLADNVPVKPLKDEGIDNLIVIRHSQAELRIDTNGKNEVTYLEITPSHSLGEFVTGTIDFSHDSILYRMSLGYYDGMRLLKEAELVEAGMPTARLELKMELMENHNRAMNENRREKIMESVQSHLDMFKKLEEQYK